VCCHDCFLTWLQVRPQHMHKWNGNVRSFLNKMVRVGTGAGEVWPRCLVTNCDWNRNTTFVYGNTTLTIASLVPYGFDGFEKMMERQPFESKFEEMEILERNLPPAVEAEDPNEDDAAAIDDVIQGDLRGAESNEIKLIITMQAKNLSVAEAREYLQQNDLWNYVEDDGAIDGVIEILY
jgi:hypothetical protein